MHVIAQGTAGAGKTTTLRSLEERFDGALYVPELYLPLPTPSKLSDKYFLANDRAKQVLASTATTALVDRDGLSTLAWIGSRDGMASPTYQDAYATHRANSEENSSAPPDVYFRFFLPFEDSSARQAASNHPAWRDPKFVDCYEKLLDELIAEFVPESSVRPIDGLMSPEQVLGACITSICSAKSPIADHGPESPFLKYRPRSFVNRKEYDTLRDPIACIILKPDCIARDLSKAVLDHLADSGIRMLAAHTKQLTQADILQLWPTFWTKSWWQETSDYMISGPSTGILCTLDKANGVDYDSLTAAKKELREQHKDPAETREAVSLIHTSDSPDETFRNVLAFWTPEEIETILDRS